MILSSSPERRITGLFKFNPSALYTKGDYIIMDESGIDHANGLLYYIKADQTLPGLDGIKAIAEPFYYPWVDKLDGGSLGGLLTVRGVFGLLNDYINGQRFYHNQVDKIKSFSEIKNFLNTDAKIVIRILEIEGGTSEILEEGTYQYYLLAFRAPNDSRDGYVGFLINPDFGDIRFVQGLRTPDNDYTIPLIVKLDKNFRNYPVVNNQVTALLTYLKNNSFIDYRIKEAKSLSGDRNKHTFTVSTSGSPLGIATLIIKRSDSPIVSSPQINLEYLSNQIGPVNISGFNNSIKVEVTKELNSYLLHVYCNGNYICDTILVKLIPATYGLA